MDDFSNDRWVSSKDIALYLGITKDTLHKWIKNKMTMSLVQYT